MDRQFPEIVIKDLDVLCTYNYAFPFLPFSILELNFKMHRHADTDRDSDTDIHTHKPISMIHSRESQSVDPALLLFMQDTEYAS